MPTVLEFQPAPPPEARECPLHGAYQASLDMGRQCPVCFKAKFKSAGITPRFQEAAFDNYDPGLADDQAETAADNLTRLREYAATFRHEALPMGRNAVLYGKVGTGKTHLAVAIGKAVMAQGFKFRLTRIYDLLYRLKATWNKYPQETEAEVLADLMALDLLALDEAGIQFGTPAEKFLLHLVIGRRYDHLKPMLILSNEGPGGLKNFLGEENLDRIRDNGLFLPFTWKSNRKAAS